ncbi:MAG: helix-turn-helix transcriptional regulator [Lachnospiraceae bacterium]|nr:helix-turn-helix transcriptional regulator [Lachnospiraceae bacterium]
MNNRSVPPSKYKQPIRDYVGRSMHDQTELVDFVPQSHIRIWYNTQLEGYNMHHHGAAEIIYCVENSYQVTTSDQTFAMEEGDILLLPPEAVHSISGSDGVRFIFLIDLKPFQCFFDYTIIEPAIMRPLFLSEKSQPQLYYKVRQHLLDITDIYFNTQSMWELMIFAELLQMYAEIGKHGFNRMEEHKTEDEHVLVYYEKFAGLLKHIDSHLEEDLSLDWAASYTGFSKYHFLRLFKDYTGMTYHEHLTHKRIQEAQKLLSTGESVTNIAVRTGFNNLTSFSRSFKKITGMSPSQYRKRRERSNIQGK